MPEMIPRPGELVEVPLTDDDAKGRNVLFAAIKSKDASGQWSIELASTPPLRGLIRLEEYEWSYEAGRWRKSVAVNIPPTRVARVSGPIVPDVGIGRAQ